MKFQSHSLLIGSVLLLVSSGVYAENRLVYPPADASKIYEYPPANFGSTPAPMMAPPSMNVVPNYINRQQPVSNGSYPNYVYPNNMQAMNGMNPYQTNNRFPFGNNMPFGNNGGNSFNPFSGNNMPFVNSSGNNFNPFSGGNMPFSNNSSNAFGMPNNPMNTMFGNNSNSNSMPFFGNTRNKNRKKAWGDKRNIWPDFYTDFTDEAWDTASSGPRDLGRMPGGWRFPHISTPDPVTVSDAITNQFPPIAEEAGNMMDFSEWGIFDDK